MNLLKLSQGSRRQAAAAAVNLFCGLLVSAFSLAHLIAVSMRRISIKAPAWVSGEPHAMIAGVPYDFRIYSLLLFGAVVFTGGVTSVRASVGIAEGSREAQRRASKAMLMVLATVIPVMPLQDAATILIVPALLSLAATCKFQGLERFARPVISRVNSCSVPQ